MAEEKHKPLCKAPPPAFSLAVKNSTLHPIGKPSASVILHSSLLPASANWSPSLTAVHAVFMGGHPTTSVPRSHLAGFTVSSISHRCILHTITAMIRLPRHSPTHKAVIIPSLSDVTTSVEYSMSFRTWPHSAPAVCLTGAPFQPHQTQLSRLQSTAFTSTLACSCPAAQ